MNTAIVREPPPRPRLWYAILGAPIAFAILGLLGWLLSAGACSPPGAGSAGHLAGSGGMDSRGTLNSGTLGLLMAVNGLALLMCLSALAAALSEWRLSRETNVTAIRGDSRTEFLAAAGLLISAIFTLSVLLMSIPIYTLSPCEVMR